jgi:hypothetical protein
MLFSPPDKVEFRIKPHFQKQRRNPRVVRGRRAPKSPPSCTLFPPMGQVFRAVLMISKATAFEWRTEGTRCEIHERHESRRRDSWLLA